MARPTPPAHVLAARGRKITLIDGTTPSVLFTFSSVMKLEDDFGSIAGAVQALGGIDSDEIKGEAFGAIAKLLAAGLEHEVDEHGAPLSQLDTLRYLLDPQELQNYSNAIGEAFEAAFPSKSDDEGAETDPTQGAESSHGQTGTTTPPSYSDEQTQSSGA